MRNTYRLVLVVLFISFFLAAAGERKGPSRIDPITEAAILHKYGLPIEDFMVTVHNYDPPHELVDSFINPYLPWKDCLYFTWSDTSICNRKDSSSIHIKLSDLPYPLRIRMKCCLDCDFDLNHLLVPDFDINNLEDAHLSFDGCFFPGDLSIRKAKKDTKLEFKNSKITRLNISESGSKAIEFYGNMIGYCRFAQNALGNVKFIGRDIIKVLHIESDTSIYEFSGMLISNAIVFRNNHPLSPYDLTNIATNKASIYFNNDSDIPWVIFNYKDFKLGRDHELPGKVFQIRFEKLIDNFDKNYDKESVISCYYDKLDFERSVLTTYADDTAQWYQKVVVLKKNICSDIKYFLLRQLGHKYNRDPFIKLLLFLFVIFFVINLTLFSKLNDVYNISSLYESYSGVWVGRGALGHIKSYSLKSLYVLIYTAIIYFGIRFDFEKASYKRWGCFIYLSLQYITGLVLIGTLVKEVIHI